MKLLLFDIDGTLLATLGTGRAALKTAVEDVFGITENFDGVTIAGNTDARNVREILAKNSIPITEQSVNQLLGAYLARLRDSLKESPGKILPGIIPLLDGIQGRADVALGLLTGNLERGAQLKLGAHGLQNRFAMGAYGDDHYDRNELGPIARKRAEIHFQNRFGPEDIYVLGDTPRDIDCGKAFGARTVAVATGNYPLEELAAENPDFLFQDFSDTKAVLKQLFADQ